MKNRPVREKYSHKIADEKKSRKRKESNERMSARAKRTDEDVYKVSGRAHEKIVNQGVNLSEAIRDACKQSDLDVLGGGHPPAAGTKIPVEKIELFLENCNTAVRNQLQRK